MFSDRRQRMMFKNSERGFSLLETILALALLGIISASFLGGLATSSKARMIADEKVSARILAESQMENYKIQPFMPTYSANETILADFPGYSVTTNVTSLGTGIQKIILTVEHSDRDVHVLEGYKVDR